jgi:hypothetical protein
MTPLTDRLGLAPKSRAANPRGGRASPRRRDRGRRDHRGSLHDGYLPYLGSVSEETLAGLQAVDPDLVLGPRRDDARQDHRLAAGLLP